MIEIPIRKLKGVRNMHKDFRRGQSILEYTLILGAIIAVLVFILLRPSGIKDKVGNAYEKTSNAVGDTTDDLTGHGVFGDGGGGVPVD